jgi:hypothetical protein
MQSTRLRFDGYKHLLIFIYLVLMLEKERTCDMCTDDNNNTNDIP